MIGCLSELALGGLLHLIMLAVVLAFATPFILVGALFGSDTYANNVVAGYASVCEWLSP